MVAGFCGVVTSAGGAWSPLMGWLAASMGTGDDPGFAPDSPSKGERPGGNEENEGDPQPGQAGIHHVHDAQYT